MPTNLMVSRSRCQLGPGACYSTVSGARMEFPIRGRLSWLRFLGFDVGPVTPDDNTIRLFRDSREADAHWCIICGNENATQPRPSAALGYRQRG